MKSVVARREMQSIVVTIGQFRNAAAAVFSPCAPDMIRSDLPLQTWRRAGAAGVAVATFAVKRKAGAVRNPEQRDRRQQQYSLRNRQNGKVRYIHLDFRYFDFVAVGFMNHAG